MNVVISFFMAEYMCIRYTQKNPMWYLHTYSTMSAGSMTQLLYTAQQALMCKPLCGVPLRLLQAAQSGLHGVVLYLIS